LLALVKEGSGVAANVLKKIGFDLQQIQIEVEKQLRCGIDTVTIGRLPKTPRVFNVLEYAMEESRNLNHNYVGTEHLLLGLLREREGVAAQVLTNLGLKLEVVRREMLSLLGYTLDTAGDKDTIFTRKGKTTTYERFTDRSRKVLHLANEEAQRFNHEYIGTEHLLLGLVKEGRGVAASVLKKFDIDLQKVRHEVEKLVGLGSDTVTMGRLPQTPDSKRVLEYATEEARKIGHYYVGTEHLLLGLLREPEWKAAQVLTNLGLQLEAVRNELLRFLGYGLDKAGGIGLADDTNDVSETILKPPVKEEAGIKKRTFCSFCNKSGREVGAMVEGLGDTHICGECVELCRHIFKKERRRGNPNVKGFDEEETEPLNQETIAEIQLSLRAANQAIKEALQKLEDR
jgi:ATP-dependent Clp protease ATP-binding subunit ClpA